MQEILASARAELTTPGEKQPTLTLVIAGLIGLFPLSLLGSGLADVFASAIAVLFLVRSAIERDFAWAREPWVVIGLAIWITLTARGALSIDPERSVAAAILWVRFIVFAAALLTILPRSPGLQRLLLGAFLAMTVFAAADALFQYVAGFDIFGRPKLGARLTGPLSNPAIGNLIVIGGLPAILFVFDRAASGAFSLSSRVVAGAIIVLLYAAVALSGERMPFLQALAVFLIACLMYIRFSWRTAAGMLALIGVVVATLIMLAPEMIHRQRSVITEIGKASNSAYGQGMLAGIEVFEKNPAFGVGVKNFKPACPQFVAADAMAGCNLIHPHQMWLHIAAEAGAVGVAAFLALFVLALTPAVRQLRRWSSDPLLAGTAISVLLQIVPLTTSGNFFSNWRSAMLFFALGVAAAVARYYERETVSAASIEAPVATRTSPAT